MANGLQAGHDEVSGNESDEMSTATAEHPRERIPHLEGWLDTEVASTRLGMTKQGIHRMIMTGKFQTARRVGPPGGRSVYVISADEIDQMVHDQDERRRQREEAEAAKPAVIDIEQALGA